MAPKSSRGGGRPIARIDVDLELSPQHAEELLQTLMLRFEDNRHRHPTLGWPEIAARLLAHPEKLASLHAMERSGGEPDVVSYEMNTDEYRFVDCSAQSPTGRRSICYDGEAMAEREKKGVYPAGSAIDLAAAMGIALLNEEQYRALQTVGEFDTTTSSWIETPTDIRARGGALFADRRYGHIFVYHNGAPSFYAARGFRGSLRV